MEDAPPLTRRARREGAASASPAGSGAAATDLDRLLTDAEAPAEADRTALGWVDPDALGPWRPTTAAGPDLLARRPHRSPLRPSVLVPFGAALALGGAYAATTLLWPLSAAAPTVTPVEIAPVTAAVSAPAWPERGSAALGVDGIASTVSSSVDASSMASITKLVTVLMALEQLPLAPGEPGREFGFTYDDRAEYWNYLARGESALDVPVDGSLTQYQLLQGILMGSAGNYTQRLADELWPSDEVFADAAATWLERHGLDGITVIEPTGIDEANAAAPAALLPLADLALANPVVAEIVKTTSAELPGAGLVESTNSLLADPSILGVKTGGLWQWYNLLSAKQITVGDTTVRLYAAVIGQIDDDMRDGESARLLDALAAEVSQPAVLPTGTLVGRVSTPWGATSDIVTAAEGSVVLWNGATTEAETVFAIDEARAAGDAAGTATYTGPLDADTIELRLTDDIEDPSAWWRLTHPLQLFGLAD